VFKEVLRFWIRMLLGLPDPDPLVRGTDPDPSIIKQKEKPRLLLFVDFFMTFCIFEKLSKCTFKKLKAKNLEKKSWVPS
jgi:hypothetical protein